MAYTGSYEGFTVLVYTPEGQHLKSCIISKHDRDAQRIELRDLMPEVLNIDDICPLLIIKGSSPREYQGRVAKWGADLVFLLFRGRDKESRTARRYRVDFAGNIDSLFREGIAYPLFEPLPVQALNISKGGLRFAAPPDTLSTGDEILINLKIENRDKQFHVHVLNVFERTLEDGIRCEYGCQLVGAHSDDE